MWVGVAPCFCSVLLRVLLFVSWWCSVVLRLLLFTTGVVGMAGGLSEWDVAITRTSPRGNTMQIAIPAAVGRSLLERGFNRATLTLTEEGILLVPFRSESVHSGYGGKVDLPGWADV